MQNDNDAVLTAIRKARHEISKDQEHDPRRVVAYYLERQKQYSDRLIGSPDLEEEVLSTIDH